MWCQLNADRYTPVDATLIPTGELRPVEGTPMDFRLPTAIGEHIKEVGGNPVGYDHNYVLNGPRRAAEPCGGACSSRSPAARWTSRAPSRASSSTRGNFLDGTITGKKGVVYRQYWGLCARDAAFPGRDEPANFPSDVLKAGTTYRSTTVYRFSVRPTGQIAGGKN